MTGSGKSTLARRIGDSTDLPWHSVDDEIGWLPGWVERPREEQREIAGRIVASERWVLDTAYGHWRELALERAQLVVALDYPRLVSLTRLIRRTLRRAITGEEMCNGNTESWRQALSRDSIIVWHFRSFKRKRERIRAWELDPSKPPVLRLHSPRETGRWLRTLRDQHR